MIHLLVGSFLLALTKVLKKRLSLSIRKTPLPTEASTNKTAKKDSFSIKETPLPTEPMKVINESLLFLYGEYIFSFFMYSVSNILFILLFTGLHIERKRLIHCILCQILYSSATSRNYQNEFYSVI